MDYHAVGGFKRQHIPETKDDQEFPPPVRLPFEFIIDFLHDAMKHNIDKIGRRQIVPQYFKLYLGTEDRETRRQYEDILIEELVYGLKTIRDDYFKNEKDPLVVEIADDAELARFEVGVGVQMMYQAIESSSNDILKVTQLEIPEPTIAESIVSATAAGSPEIQPIDPDVPFEPSDRPEINSSIPDNSVSESEDTQNSGTALDTETVNDSDLEKRFRFMVEEAKGKETKQSDAVVDLAVNMSASDDSESEITVESAPDDYDDSLYQDEEDIDPEVLARLKRDRKFYEEWKARGRVPTLLSRNANRQSERRMGHKD